MRPAVFETERLIAHDWAPEDVDGAFAMYGDPEVVRFIGGVPEPDRAAMARRLAALIERNAGWPDGYGSFPMFRKDDGALVGTSLLKVLPDAHDEPSGDVEIGWHLARPHWGAGYATEMGRGLVELGFGRHGLDVLHALVDPANERSLAVVRRLGMTSLGRTRAYYGGLHAEHFVLRRADG